MSKSNIVQEFLAFRSVYCYLHKNEQLQTIKTDDNIY
jgi:hypothetical protein